MVPCARTALIFLCCTVVRAAPECEEVELLQDFKDAKRMTERAASGSRGVAPTLELTVQMAPGPKDLERTLDKAKEAITKVAADMTKAFDNADLKLSSIEDDFKNTGGFMDFMTSKGPLRAESIKRYENDSKADFPLAKNLTDFKALVKKSVSALLTFFDEASDQVTKAFSAADSTLSMMGQRESLDKLKHVESAVKRDMTDLANISQGLRDDLSGAGAKNMGDYLVTMTQKLDFLNSVSAELTKKIQDELADFGGSVVEPFTLAGGNRAASAVGQLSAKSHRMLNHLQTYLSLFKDTLNGLSAGLDSSRTRDEGFVSRVLRNILGGR